MRRYSARRYAPRTTLRRYRARRAGGYSGAPIPRVANVTAGGGGIVISFREYIMDISSSDAFSGVLLPLNPGMADTFPWLSQIAQQFQEYKFEGLIFEYRSMAEQASASALATGTVIAATQYNAAAPAFASKAEMENSEFGMSVKPERNLVHKIETARGSTPINPMYVRMGAIGSHEDIKTYDLGYFQLATQGIPIVGQDIGELWVSYQVRLLKPQLTGGFNSLNTNATVLYSSANCADNNGFANGYSADSKCFSGFLRTAGSTDVVSHTWKLTDNVNSVVFAGRNDLGIRFDANYEKILIPKKPFARAFWFCLYYSGTANTNFTVCAPSLRLSTSTDVITFPVFAQEDFVKTGVAEVPSVLALDTAKTSTCMSSGTFAISSGLPGTFAIASFTKNELGTDYNIPMAANGESITTSNFGTLVLIEINTKLGPGLGDAWDPVNNPYPTFPL